MRTHSATRNRVSKHRTTLDIYLDEINRYPLLERDEEVALARRAAAGESQALEELVRANLRFVVSVARRYARSGVPLEDLINDGNMGLIRAARRFDPERGYKFISYAVWWIKQAILNSLSKNSRLVRLPLNRASLVVRVGRAKRELEAETGREPTPEAIAKRLDISVAEVLDAIEINSTHVSLDERFSDDAEDSSFVDYLEDIEGPAPDAGVYSETLAHDIHEAVDTLPERERIILVRYFGLDGEEPKTLEVIGQELGYTRERIRQLKEVAFERLRSTPRGAHLAAYMQN